MANTKTTRRPPVPKDIKAARSLLDELMIAREDNAFLRKQNAMLERRSQAAETKLATRPKPKPKKAPARG